MYAGDEVFSDDVTSGQDEWPTDEQLVNWREADEYRNELDEREDEDNTYDPDGPHEDHHGFGDTWDDELAPCGCYANDPGCTCIVNVSIVSTDE